MRVTVNSMMNTYNRRLNTVMKNMNSAADRVTTGRKYLRGSEDPAAAVRSNKLRKQYRDNENFLTNLRDVRSKFDGVESSLMKVSKVAEDAYVDTLVAVTGTTSPEQRGVIAAKLREMQKSLVMEMNATNAGDYIFGGTNTKTLPYSIDEATGAVMFNGLDVSDPANEAAFKAMAGESVFIDLGFGITTDAAGNIDKNSAYDTATSGVSVLGYGTNADGTSKNLVALLGQMATALEDPAFTAEGFEKFSKALDTQRNGVIVEVTKLGSNTMFLDYTEKRLGDMEFNLNNQILDTEFMDPAKAISEFKMQDYVYRATLKMGVDILTPSFIDFMR